MEYENNRYRFHANETLVSDRGVAALPKRGRPNNALKPALLPRAKRDGAAAGAGAAAAR